MPFTLNYISYSKKKQYNKISDIRYKYKYAGLVSYELHNRPLSL